MAARTAARTARAGQDPITAYASAVVAGDVEVQPDVERACTQHLKDLRVRRVGAFSAQAAQRAIARVGRLTREERFIVGALLGWWCWWCSQRMARTKRTSLVYLQLAASRPRLANRILVALEDS